MNIYKYFLFTSSEKRAMTALFSFVVLLRLSIAFAFSTQSVHGEVSVDESHDSIPTEQTKVLIEINSADSVALLDLYGIGPSFASRIVKYRNLLGGYYNTQQLFEVYGMDSVRYAGFSDDIQIDTSCIKKITLSTCTFKQLLRHPYMSYDAVKRIFRYRDRMKQGILQPVHLVENNLISDSLWKKISPYLR